jgi:hypothetical protein
MKLTIEIDTAKGEHKSKEAIALLGGSVLLALLDNEQTRAAPSDDAAPVTDSDDDETRRRPSAPMAKRATAAHGAPKTK